MRERVQAVAGCSASVCAAPHSALATGKCYHFTVDVTAGTSHADAAVDICLEAAGVPWVVVDAPPDVLRWDMARVLRLLGRASANETLRYSWRAASLSRSRSVPTAIAEDPCCSQGSKRRVSLGRFRRRPPSQSRFSAIAIGAHRQVRLARRASRDR